MAAEGKCMICKKDFEGIRIDTDHDHRTGKVRGLLCHPCNLGLGGFKDSISNLEAGIEYLRKSK